MKRIPLIHQAVSAAVALGNCPPHELQRALLALCETKEQAGGLANQMQRMGYIERQVLVTDKARKRVSA